MNARRFPITQVLAAMLLALEALSLGAMPALARPSGEAVVTTWTVPTPIVSGLQNAAEPVLAYTPDGARHAMWQADGKLYYAAQKPGQEWVDAKRIASGTSPALAVDGGGQLHAVFANSFQGNYEIYHIRLVNGVWSFPISISRTSGHSMQPVLVVDKTQGLHAAWMEYIAETWMIYVGTWEGGFWSSYPASNALGKDPALAVLTDGTVGLAWQRWVQELDAPDGRYEIFSSERSGPGWSIPVNVSARADKRTANSTGVTAQAGPDGRIHLAWQEDERAIWYDFGRDLYWPSPVVVASSDVIARGPQLALREDGVLDLAWDEGETIRVASAPAGSTIWSNSSLLIPPLGDQKDVTLAPVAGSGLSIGWVQTRDGISSIYESRRVFRSTADMPVKVRIPDVRR